MIQFGHAANGSSSYDWAADAAHRAAQAGSPDIAIFAREQIFERDGWICYLCGDEVDRDASPFDCDSATIDHVVPLSKGGRHVTSNVRTAHLRCNSAKQDHLTAASAA